MKIWVDADACPVVNKQILCRAAEREKIQVRFVANQYLTLPPSKYIDFIQVPRGFDAADNEIIKQLDSGDLLITGDIPLAAEAIEKGALALNHRGELYSSENIKECLNMRDFFDTLRASGMETGGQSALTQSDRQAFANQLDKFLSRYRKTLC